LAASIALITSGGVAGIIVGGAGAEVAREHAQSADATGAVDNSVPYAHAMAAANISANDAAEPTMIEGAPVGDAAASGLDTPEPIPVRRPAVAVDMDSVFPEDAPEVRRPVQRTVTETRAPARATAPAAERVRPRTPTPPMRATAQPTPAATAATETRPQPAPARAQPARRPTRTARTTPQRPARTPARAATTPVHTAPPPQMPATPLVVSPTATSANPPVDATRRTTMSQGDSTAAPSPSAPAPAAPAPAPESASTLLANP
jgi:hypothetical protein